MTEQDLDLIHRELDGETSHEESEHLRALLEQDAEARKEFDALRVVAARLSELRQVEPPSDLTPRIMAALPTMQRPGATGRSLSSILADIRSGLTARPALAYAYTLVVGLVLGLGLYAVALDRDAPDAEDLYGALVSRGAELYESAVRLPGAEALVQIRATGSLLVVDADVEAAEETVLRLVSGERMTFNGFTRHSGDALASLEAGAGDVTLTMRGTGRYAVLFDLPPDVVPPLQIEFSRDGERLHSETVTMAPD